MGEIVVQENHNASPVCPCGGIPKGARYAACCQPYIEGLDAAPTAERLMRSRYSAYALGKAAYVKATWHPSTRPADLALAAPGTPHATRWLRLAVHSHAQLTDTEAQVTFTATYRENGRAHQMEECSRFVLEDGRWLYVEGTGRPATRINGGNWSLWWG